MKVLAVIPAYNEEDSIAATILKTARYVDGIVVVDDGSTDRTSEQATKSGVKVVRLAKNRGKGAALHKGMQVFLESEYDVVFTIDADGQHDPRYIPHFIKLIEEKGVEMVVASRFGTKDWLENMPFMRKISNLLSRFGLWILYNGYIVEDPQNGFRAFTRAAVEMIDFSSPNPKKRFGFEAETKVLIEARIHGVRQGVLHIPSLYFEDRVSKFSLLMDTWSIPLLMLKYFFIYKPWLHRHKFTSARAETL